MPPGRELGPPPAVGCLPEGAPAVRTLRLDHRAQEMPLFDQELFLQAQAKGPLTDSKYVQARANCVRLARKEGIDGVLAKHRLNAGLYRRKP